MTVVTFPSEVVQRVADRLCDMDWNLAPDVAYEAAADIVILVTVAVDKLRASEAKS